MENMTTTITNTVEVMAKRQQATNERVFKILTMMEEKLDKLEPSFPDKRLRTASGAHVNLEQTAGASHDAAQTDDMSMAGEICTVCHFVMVPRRSHCTFLTTHICVCVVCILSRFTCTQGSCMGISGSQTRWYHSRSDETSIHSWS
jgi:hypothetical protein